jgi:ABC-2 type transport system permease protein
MNSPFLNLLVVQFKEFYREPSVLFWGFLFPVLMIAVLGLAFMNRPVLERTIAVVGPMEKYSPGLTQKLDSLDRAGDFRFITMSEQDALQKIRRGQISVYINRSSDGEIVFSYDPDNNEARMTYLLATNALLSASQVGYREEYITATGHRYIDFLVPGLLAMGIMNSCLWGIGWNLIDFRIKKLMRRMIATPMRKSVFLLAQVVSRAILLIIEAFIIFSFAHWAFGVEIQGSVFALLLVLLSGVTAFSGVAVLLASRARHSQVGNGIINAVTMPSIILSGIFFSYQNFPEWAASVVRFFPLTLLADAMRAIFNEGAYLRDVWIEVLLLIIVGFTFFVGGLKIFKWR